MMDFLKNTPKEEEVNRKKWSVNNWKDNKKYPKGKMDRLA